MYNRKHRRWQLRTSKMLRIKNIYSRFSPIAQAWYNKTMSEGSKLYDLNRERVEKAIYESLSEKEASLKQTYVELGYSDAKIEKMLEAWRLTTVKNSETYRSDRKRATALLREAQAM